MTDLRRTTVDLYDLAEEHRADAQDAREDKGALEAKARELVADDDREDIGGVSDLPTDMRQEHEQCKQLITQHLSSAESLEHYADQWGDGDTCEFTLQELNGDEYANVLDTASASARAQANGQIPQGLGGIKSLEFGVIDIPDSPDLEPDPGHWPAVIVNDLFQELNEITTPSGVDLGNESLRQAVEEADAPEVEPTNIDPEHLTPVGE